MFVVSEAEAAAIRALFEQRGDLSAAVELRLFPRHHQHRAGARMRPDHCRLEAESVPLRPVMRIRRGHGGRDGLVEDMRAEWGGLDRRIEGIRRSSAAASFFG